MKKKQEEKKLTKDQAEKKEKDKVAANEKKTGKRRASARIDSPRVPRPSLGSAGNEVYIAIIIWI